MRIGLSGIFVDDQDKALAFYTEKLGFEKRHDIPLGEHRWLTVAAPEGTQEVELLLEPNAHPAAKAYQEAIHGDGIPAAMFFTDDIQGEHDKLEGRGVTFTTPPTEAGGVTLATFDDTCGNLIQLVQQ